MNILLISQCEKKALKETRRIIDQFAERYGDRAWQTAITKQGLETLYKLLKKTARKNTAVACHWIRGKNKTELLWVVGNRNQFSDRGRVPTNRTKRKLVQSHHENNWRDGASIQIISTLAALLHDIGKATIGFQEKLRGARNGADPYRHEWISLQLFILMIQDCKTNEDVLKRLMTFDEYQKNHPDWYIQLNQVPRKNFDPRLDTLPSVAKWLGWLIVSHHRMPFTIRDEKKDWDIEKQKYDDNEYVEDLTPQRFFKQLQAFKGWVCPISDDDFDSLKFWQLKAVITKDPNWLKRLQNEAREALAHSSLVNQGDITDPFLLHFSRLSLMMGDYHFSSQENKTESFEEDETKLFANTKQGFLAQTLGEHLIGVAKHTKQMARSLPFFSENFPTLINKELIKRTTEQRFLWQNRAFDLVKTLQQPSNEAGFFGVNMASTGCGKTVANVRILYGITDPKQGVRVTIALGLRILTLQTGRALKDMLKLNDKSVATVVGGNKIQNLFASEHPIENAKEKGSDSTEELLFEFIEGGSDAEDEINTVIKDEKSRKLLFSPVVACTIDHLTHVTECARGGKYIVPTLRLFSSDVILDEPDDFDQNDLPALARLVFSVGFCGRKIVLSSATLTPDLILGLFNAYQAGRKIWQHQLNKANLPIPCGWFDEFTQSSECITTPEEFTAHHSKFVEGRIVQLKKQAKRRKAEIMPLLDYQTQNAENDNQFFSILAAQIKDEAYKLHGYHHNVDPQTDKKISVGLIRFSHTRDVIALVRGMYDRDDLPNHTQCHIVVYHAKQLQLLRNKLEERLDKILNRSEPLKLFNHLDIRKAIDGSSAENHIFIVVSTPITEVGRDHDYDWAIIEPSSMRSIIQLAGRVWRHRPEKEAIAANISILGKNISALREGSVKPPPYYCKPGFETKRFLLTAYECKQLISEEELENITAIPRIQNTEKTTDTLKGLEHISMSHLFNTSDVEVKGQLLRKRKSNVVTSYWQPDLAHAYCTHLQHLTPFRKSEGKETEYVCQYNEDNEHGLHFSTAEKAREFPDELSASSENSFLRYQSWDTILQMNPRIKPWLTCELDEALTDLKERLGKKYEEWPKERLAVQFSTVTLRNEQEGWCYHPWFGFYQEK